jgi:hypothetical protein
MKRRGIARCFVAIAIISSLAPASAQQKADSVEAELARVGYPTKVSLAEAVHDFNRRAEKDSIGRTQPPLTLEEVTAAIRAWNREDDPIAKSAYDVFQTVARTAIVPKGCYIRYIPGLIGRNGYDFDIWWIDLQVELDKYPTDMADVPMYARRIRTTYISSRPHKAQ